MDNLSWLGSKTRKMTNKCMSRGKGEQLGNKRENKNF